MRFSELISDWRVLASYLFGAPTESFAVGDRDSLWAEVARRGVVQIERRSLYVVGGARLVHQTLVDEALGVVGDRGASGHPGGQSVRRERERALASWSHVEGRLAGETGARQRELRGHVATLFRQDAVRCHGIGCAGAHARPSGAVPWRPGARGHATADGKRRGRIVGRSFR